MIKLVLIDDHQLILSGIVGMLSTLKDMEISASFTDAEEGASFVETHDIDVLVTDLDMPNFTGVDVIRRVRAAKPNQRIIVLSMIDERSIINRMIKYDVNGYLMKNEAQAELPDAIRKVYRGEIFYNKEIRSMLFKEPALPSDKKRKIPRLSAREKEILKLVIQENTTRQIAAKLFISEGTVITHRKHIITKLGVKNTAGMVRMALELGLV